MTMRALVRDRQLLPANVRHAGRLRAALERDGLAISVLAFWGVLLALAMPYLVNQDSWLAFVDGRLIAQHGLPQMIRDGVHKFVNTLSGKAEIALVTFGERPTIQVDYTQDTKKLNDAADRLFPRTGAGSYLLDALVEVSKGLQKREAKRPVIAVLMLEDVEFSNRYYKQVVEELDKSRAALHVIAIGQPSGNARDEIRNRSQTIAEGTERTGGRRDQVLAISATEEKMGQLANELLNQYLVTYARPDTLIPPEKISVSVTGEGLTARARTRTGGNK